jgi:hypothetical protein
LTTSIAATVWLGHTAIEQVVPGRFEVAVIVSGYVPGGVVGDVDTVNWPVATFVLKSAGGKRVTGLSAARAPAGRPLTPPSVTPMPQTCDADVSV